MKKVFLISNHSGHTVSYMKRENQFYRWTSKINDATVFFTQELAKRAVWDFTGTSETVLKIEEVYMSKILTIANQKTHV